MALSFDDTTPLTDEQMDELTGENSGPTMPPEPQEAPAQDPAPDPKAAKPSDEFEFNHQGKQIRASREQILQYSQQGYDYAQKMAQLKQERAQWEQERQTFDQERSKYEPYRQIDEYAKKNQDWWNFVQNQWQQKDLKVDPSTGKPDPTELKLRQFEQNLSQRLEQRFGELTKPIQEVYQDFESRKKAEKDQRLTDEIKSIRETYKDLDFDSRDAEGKSLEYRVLEHAQKNRIGSFTTAFRDLLHDQLIARAENIGKQAVAKTVQRNSKLGILGESPTPKRAISEAQDIRNKSYEDLHREALEELAAMRA